MVSDKQKAIEYFEKLMKKDIKQGEYFSKFYYYDLAIESLKRQSKFDTTTITYWGINNNDNCLYQCGECGGLDILFDFDYCPHCGRKIE